MTVLDGRQLLVSVFILAVIGLKVSEIVFQLEEFPLTHTGMFAEYEPKEKIPWTFTLEGWRGGRWREIRPWMLHLEPDVVISKLGSDLEKLPETCGALLDPVNRVRPRWLRWRRARVRALAHARPGTTRTDERRTVDCSLDPSALEGP